MPPETMQAPPRLRPREVALMFSGGIDSTATAIRLAEDYDRVHLLTYRNGYGHLRQDRTRRRYEELRRRVGGDRFRFALISTRDLFERVLVRSAVKDYRRYGSGFVWCMGCKLAMHTRSIMYCLEHGLVEMTDGSNSETDEMVEQMLISLTLVRDLYARFGVRFGTPVYEQGREASRRVIDDAGVRLGPRVMDRHVGIQPTCVAGELYYIPYLLFHKRVRHDEASVARFISDKLPACEAAVREHLEDRCLDADALIAERRRLIQRG